MPVNNVVVEIVATNARSYGGLGVLSLTARAMSPRKAKKASRTSLKLGGQSCKRVAGDRFGLSDYVLHHTPKIRQ